MKFNSMPVVVLMVMFFFGLLALGSLATAVDERQKPKPESVPKAKPVGMNNAKLDALIRRIDKNTQGRPGFWELNVEGRVIAVITDEKSDRMRIISAVAKADEVKTETLQRLMQANFDSTLDARYSIAKGTLWSAFIHPLASLSEAEFLSGLGQVVNLSLTYGTSYSSGAVVFNGGDSAVDLQRRELIDRLLKKGLEI